MAGVGFSLRALGASGNASSWLRLYATAGIISSGPWLLSILTLLFVGLLGRQLVPDPAALDRYQVSVTWLFAASLVWTGPFQLMFTRFSADRDYAGERREVFPNLLGLLAVTAVLSTALAVCAALSFGSGQVLLKIVLGTAFVSLSELWLVVAVLGGIRAHGQVLASFAVGYAITFVASLLLARFGELGLLTGFALGQAALLFHGLGVLARHAPDSRRAAWRFLKRDAIYLELGVIGFVYNLGVWIDKLLFWFNPTCSRQVIGPLRASEVYDLPTFLAYLTIVPGMAVFLVRVETDFAEHHAAFFDAIRNGAALPRIEALCDALTSSARRALFDIVRVQGIALAACFALGPSVLRLCGISELHLPLFYIDALGVMLQVLLLAVMSMLFYLDRRRAASWLAGLLLVSNAAATLITQDLGSEFYGYGFTLAMACTCIVGLRMLTHAFSQLVQDTFMRQPGAA